jgi:hypothetical protein
MKVRSGGMIMNYLPYISIIGFYGHRFRLNLEGWKITAIERFMVKKFKYHGAVISKV